MSATGKKWYAGFDCDQPVLVELEVRETPCYWHILNLEQPFEVQAALHWLNRIHKESSLGKRFFDRKSEAIECLRRLLAADALELTKQVTAIVNQMENLETL